MTEGEKAINSKFSLSLPQFRYAQQLSPSCGVPILFMRLGAPHKIDRCANRCSLYPPQAAVAYVARQRGPVFHQIRGNNYNKPRQARPVGVIIYILLFGFLQFFECCPLSRIVYRYTFLEKHIVIFRKPRLAELCVRKAFLACGNAHF